MAHKIINWLGIWEDGVVKKLGFKIPISSSPVNSDILSINSHIIGIQFSALDLNKCKHSVIFVQKLLQILIEAFLN